MLTPVVCNCIFVDLANFTLQNLALLYLVRASDSSAHIFDDRASVSSLAGRWTLALGCRGTGSEQVLLVWPLLGGRGQRRQYIR